MGRAYYITRSGQLRRKENTLYLEMDQEKKPIPVEDMDELYLFGELDLNTKLLNFMGQKGVLVHAFNYYGYYTGSFYPRETNVSGHLLVQQVEHYLNYDKRLYLARKFVEGAFFHLRRNLLYYQRRRAGLASALALIELESGNLQEAGDVAELMGIEGRARDGYYKAFNYILSLDIPFVKRIRHPPNNMINTLISFGNSLLYAATLAELYVTQLHPTLSYLHEPGTRRFSLALDIAEVFKPLIVDRIIFRMLNKNMLGEEGFESVGEAKGLYLTEESKKVFLREWEKSLMATVRHRRLKRNVSYRQLIRLEGYRLVRHLLGIEPYEPLKAWW